MSTENTNDVTQTLPRRRRMVDVSSFKNEQHATDVAYSRQFFKIDHLGYRRRCQARNIHEARLQRERIDREVAHIGEVAKDHPNVALRMMAELEDRYDIGFLDRVAKVETEVNERREAAEQQMANNRRWAVENRERIAKREADRVERRKQWEAKRIEREARRLREQEEWRFRKERERIARRDAFNRAATEAARRRQQSIDMSDYEDHDDSFITVLDRMWALRSGYAMWYAGIFWRRGNMFPEESDCNSKRKSKPCWDRRRYQPPPWRTW